jgi:hypothetical protein
MRRVRVKTYHVDGAECYGPDDKDVNDPKEKDKEKQAKPPTIPDWARNSAKTE